MNTGQRRSIATFTLMWIAVQILYWPAWRAGFVTDFTGLMERFDGQDASGILNSFGFPAQQQVLNFFLYFFYRLFGTAPLPWHLTFTTLHTFNAFLFFSFHKTLLRHLGVSHSTFIALGGAILFLVCPYQSEPVIWKVGLNYLLSTLLILISLRYLTSWLANKKHRFPWRTQLPYLLALFTFEFAFTLPFLSLALLIFWTLVFSEWTLLWRRFRLVVLPQLTGIVFYFGLNRLTLGRWIGHYGADVHLNLAPEVLIGTVLKYTAKLLGLVRYYAHPLKESIFNSLDRPLVIIIFALLFMGGAFWYAKNFKRLSSKGRSAGLLLLFYLIALAPVANIFFLYLLHVENDRYSYLASGFFFTLAALSISYLPRLPRASVLVMFVVLHTWLLTRTIRYWREATLVYEELLDTFRWHEAPAIYLLNLPDNLQGVLLFRDYGGDGQTFLDALRYLRKHPYPGNLHEVASYNLTSPGDGIQVEWQAVDTLRVTFSQWGNWWWRDGRGASDFEDDHFQFINQGHHYLLVPKSIEPGAVLLYQTGNRWEVVEPPPIEK